jgi:DNA-binding beta-propeller fold protein YncE
MKTVKIVFMMMLGLLLFAGCSTNKEYKFVQEISLNGMKPISIAVAEDGIWISDSENNRVVKIDDTGKIINEFDGFRRPMQIGLANGKLYVPEYLTDSIKVIIDDKVIPFNLGMKPDAPAGIDADTSIVAVADFYNHRIIIKDKKGTYTFGSKGHKKGELFYPTDVKIIEDKIFVADAYNNRVQVFSKKGKAISVIGDKDTLKVASGVDADENNIFVTDSNNNRVLVYDWEGNRIQTLTQNISYPIDVVLNKDKLYISNFHKGTISIYEK